MGKYATVEQIQAWLSTQTIGGPGGNFNKGTIPEATIELWISQQEAAFDNYARGSCPELQFSASSLTVISRWVQLMVVADSRLGTFFVIEMASAIRSLQAEDGPDALGHSDCLWNWNPVCLHCTAYPWGP